MLRIVAVLLLAVVAMAPAQAQNYPNQPIKFVIAFGPGAATDVYARLVAESLQGIIGQPVIVENRPGANGSIAAEQVARAKPDGYTLMFSTATAHASNVWLMKEIRYNPVTDFVPITRLGLIAFTIAVSGDSPYKSLQDLIDAARKQPDKLSIASANASGLVSVHSFLKTFDLKMTLVEYKSSPQALTDVLGGRVTAMVADFVGAAGQLSAGKLRPLAVTTKKRSPLYPDVPTMDELGVKGFDVVGWFGLYAPKGTSSDIVKLLNAKVAQAVAKPELKPQFTKLGLEVFTSTPEALAEHTKAEIRAWERYVMDFGIQPE